MRGCQGQAAAVGGGVLGTDYAVRMKSPTWPATVNRALEAFVRRARARRILELRGCGLWEGDLAEMRGDAVAPKPRGKR